MDTFEAYADKLIRSLNGTLNTDSAKRRINELYRRVDAGELISDEEARAIDRVVLALKGLATRGRSHRKRIDRELAKRAEHLQRAYRQEPEGVGRV